VTANLRDLYQEVILDHQRSPRNFRVLLNPDGTSTGHNPLCGDQVTVYVKLGGDKIADVSFQGTGCAICTASASMMTDQVKGKPLDQVETLFEAFHGLVTGQANGADGLDSLGKLRVFSGVRQFPIRVKCATLPWHTLRAAIEGRGETVSTE
jgi:nitrogen fixation NifU-like protein